MSKTIVQKVSFPGVSPECLYETYMSSKKHGAAVESKAAIQNQVGGKFAAYNMLTGKFLLLAKDTLIVQTWRANNWETRDPDSILILKFTKTRGGGQIGLVHAFVPDYDYADIKKGWPKFYWKPWKKYFSRK